MAKKDFGEINTGNIFAEQIESAVSETIQAPIPRQKQGELPTEEIVQMAREQGKTQGRAGCKAHRFNMAFTPKAYDFIVCMARVRGETITGFVNHLIEKCIDDNQEIYQKALEFRDSL
ncbi:MAG: hypothetical protein II631_06830 [Treponema sp.]|nr:hypothetical protein [Treponema sp.]